MARELQPHLIINDRCGLDADYYPPEQHVGHFQNDRPWESCITLGTQWAWKPNDQLKPYTEAIYGTRGGPYLAPDMNKRQFNSARTRFSLPGGRLLGGLASTLGLINSGNSIIDETESIFNSLIRS